MTLSLITHLVQSYGYYAVFTLIALKSMGIPLPGETARAAHGQRQPADRTTMEIIYATRGCGLALKRELADNVRVTSWHSRAALPAQENPARSPAPRPLAQTSEGPGSSTGAMDARREQAGDVTKTEGRRITCLS